MEVKLSYADFRYAYAGDWGGRLRVRAYPACYATTPVLPDCARGVEIPSVNDPVSQTITFVSAALGTPLIEAPADSIGGGFAGRHAPRAARAAVDNTSTVYALSADAGGGDGGNYAAMPLSPTGEWQVGEGSGEFSYQYPVELGVTAVAGPKPTLEFGYSSGSVDGMTNAANGQASGVGLGWSMGTAYIMRTFRDCDEDGWTGKHDLCWMWDEKDQTPFNDLSIVLNGHSSRLIRIGVSNSFRLQNDPGWLVTRVAAADADLAPGAPNNDDNDNEAFKVQTPDGVTYWFGGLDFGTHSVSTVPVYGNDPGEPCFGSAAVPAQDKWCQQAWKWSVDWIIDARGNSSTLAYDQEVNHYARNGDIRNKQSYNSGSSVIRIQYGGGATGNYNEARFDLAPRCVSALDDPSAPCAGTPRARPDDWPDVPADLICEATDSTCSNTAPSFFSRKRYSSITTERHYTDAAGVRNLATADTYTFSQTFPAVAEGGIRDLWLTGIVRKGIGAPQVTMPRIGFVGSFLRNRVVAPEGSRSFSKMRISQVQLETGGRIDVVYGHDVGRTCDAAYVQDLPRMQSERECFPAQFRGSWEWWHKYVVKRIALSDPRLGINYVGAHTNTTETNLGRLRVYDYDYVGSPAWRYRNNPSVASEHETWDDWRGYDTVLVGSRRVGADQIPNKSSTGDTGLFSKRKVIVYRGMDATRRNNERVDGSYVIHEAAVTTTDGVQHEDSTWFAGRVLEETVQRWNGKGWIADSRTTSSWAQFQTASYNYGPQARFVYRRSTSTMPRTGAAIRTTTYAVSDGGSEHRGVTLGTPTSETDNRGTATPADDVATCTDWNGNNTTWLRAPRRVQKMQTDCSSGKTIARTENYYDGHADLLAAPTYAELTQAVTFDGRGNSRRVQHAYDNQGRLIKTSQPYLLATSAFDPSALESHPYSLTDYNTSGANYRMPTTIRTTGPIGASDVTQMSTSVTLSLTRGLTTSATDANGRTTTITYDGIGRRLTVTKPGLPAGTPAGTPSIEYSYLTPALEDGPRRVITKTLRDTAGTTPVFDHSWDYYDGWGRAIQHQERNLAGNGRLVDSTGFDDRGLPWLTMPDMAASGADGKPETAISTDVVPHYSLSYFDASQRSTSVVDKSRGKENFTTRSAWGPTSDQVRITPRGSTTAVASTRKDLNPAGQVTAVTQYANGKSADTTRDGYARYTYTPAGELSTIKTPVTAGTYANLPASSWATYTYSYDWLGQRLEASDPDTGVTDYTYDAFGNILRQSQPALTSTDGIVESTYDSLGRPKTRKNIVGGSTRSSSSWSYGEDPAKNTVGRLVKTVQQSNGWTFGSAVNGYDARGNEISTTVTYPRELTGEAGSGDVALTSTSSYNHRDQLTSAAQPALPGLPASSTTLEYGNNGTYLSTTDGQRYLGAATYDSSDRLVALGSGTDTADPQMTYRTYEWSDQGRLKNQLGAIGPVGAQLYTWSAEYAYDVLGNPTRIIGQRLDSPEATVEKAAWCYSYDSISRLTRARAGVPAATGTSCDPGSPEAVARVTGTTYDVSYGYTHARLNAVQSGSTGPKVQFGYGAGRPHAATVLTSMPGAGSATALPSPGTLAYDAAGRATKWSPTGDPATTFDYDGLGNLMSSTVGTTSTTYAYDDSGMRLVRKSPTETVLDLGGAEIHAVKSGATTTLSSRRIYTAPDGTPLGIQSSEPASAPLWTWQIADQHQSIRYTYDGRGNKARHEYLPYGDPVDAATRAPGERGYLDQVRDPDGSVRLDHRQYQPSLNVLTTPDPILKPFEPQSLNPYAYSRFNPISASDPTGLDPGPPPCYPGCSGDELDCSYSGGSACGPGTPGPVEQGEIPGYSDMTGSQQDVIQKLEAEGGADAVRVYLENDIHHSQLGDDPNYAAKNSYYCARFDPGSCDITIGDVIDLGLTIAAIYGGAGAVNGLRFGGAVTGEALGAVGATNAANGARLSKQLALESARSVFTESGGLSPEVVRTSRRILSGRRLGNRELIARLTSDGSQIEDWGKFVTRTFQSPFGDFQVHFYMNRVTKMIDYGYDYKSIFTGVPR